MKFLEALAITGFCGIGAAGLGTASGVTGSFILRLAGYEGYDIAEAAQMGAIGGGILGTGYGAITSALTSCGFFENDKNNHRNTEISFATGVGYLVIYGGFVVLEGLTGYGVMNTYTNTVMKLAETAAAFAVGAPLAWLPSTIGCGAIILPIALGVCCFKMCKESALDDTLDDERISEVNIIIDNEQKSIASDKSQKQYGTFSTDNKDEQMVPLEHTF